MEAALVAMAGHSGARLIFVLENRIDAWIKAKIKDPGDPL
jgi:hypothetical protein